MPWQRHRLALGSRAGLGREKVGVPQAVGVSRIVMSECEPRIPDELWIEWSKAERCGRWLLRGSGLPSADQEIALDAALEVLLLVWQKVRVVENPAAWLGTLLVRRLHEIRRYGVAGELPADLLAGQAGSEVLDAAEAAAGRQAADWWQIVLRHEAAVLGKLSGQEQRVSGAVRGGRSLKEVAGELGMSGRDVRTRFRRVCDRHVTASCNQCPRLTPPAGG